MMGKFYFLCFMSLNKDMVFQESQLSAAEYWKLRMIKLKLLMRASGLPAHGMVRMYFERYPEDFTKQEYVKVRNVFGTVSSDKAITIRFEKLVEDFGFTNLEDESHG